MSLRHINLLLSLTSCGFSIRHLAQVWVTTPNFFNKTVFFSALNQTLHLSRILAVYLQMPASLRLLGMVIELILGVDRETFEHCNLNAEIHWQE
jgi:hypothetical protein